MITPALSRRRNTTVVVRREDALRAAAGPRARSRRARRRICWGAPSKFGAIAVGVLLAAALCWLFVFVYLLAPAK
jgi:hypothetical protein